MTPEQQRIAIAEVCGWTRKSLDPSHPITKPEGRWELRDKIAYHYGQLPDYLNDLNAMHEAEKVIYNHEHIYMCNRYVEKLATIVVSPGGQDLEDYEGGPDFYRIFLITRATAAQRAEAFLRTLNLWKP